VGTHPFNDPFAAARLAEVWIPVGVPGYSGPAKAQRTAAFDARFGADGWRYAHVVRGEVVPFAAAIAEYEESYRRFLRARPALVAFLVAECGNVYDHEVANVFDDAYVQPGPVANHYQDVAVRRVIAELVDDPAWPDVTDTDTNETDLVDLGTGETHRVPRARGFRGASLLQIREPTSPGYCLNPAVVPAHDPALITTMPGDHSWFHDEGCAHLSIEAFWQTSKVVEVRYDRFLALPDDVKLHPLDGV
jgi:hypothetical protein